MTCTPTAFGRKPKTPFEKWISFFPISHVIGVRWMGWDFCAGPNYGEAPKPNLKHALATAQPEVSTGRANREEATLSGRWAAADEAPSKVAAEAAAPAQDTVSETALRRPSNLFDTPPEAPDDLKQIKGVGPKLAGLLNGLGVYTFAQIAEFSEADLRWVDENLSGFKGRAWRDEWAAQAKRLMS